MYAVDTGNILALPRGSSLAHHTTWLDLRGIIHLFPLYVHYIYKTRNTFHDLMELLARACYHEF